MSCTPLTDIYQLYIVLLSLPEAFIPQRVSKNKLRHVNQQMENYLGLDENTYPSSFSFSKRLAIRINMQ